MKTPLLETERLILKPISVSEAQTVFDAWASDPRVTKFMHYSAHTDVSVTEEWLKDVQNELESDLTYDWGFYLKDGMKLIGSGGAYYKPELEAYNIGYNLAYDYWHKGFATEAMQAVVHFLKTELGARKVTAYYAAENKGSGRVLEKLGLRYVRESEYAKFDGSVTFKAKDYSMDL